MPADGAAARDVHRTRPARRQTGEDHQPATAGDVGGTGRRARPGRRRRLGRLCGGSGVGHAGGRHRSPRPRHRRGQPGPGGRGSVEFRCARVLGGARSLCGGGTGRRPRATPPPRQRMHARGDRGGRSTDRWDGPDDRTLRRGRPCPVARLQGLVNAAGGLGPGRARRRAARCRHPGLALAQRRRLPGPS